MVCNCAQGLGNLEGILGDIWKYFGANLANVFARFVKIL
jgi:hypothetical protein